MTVCRTWSFAEVRKSCRSRKITLQNECYSIFLRTTTICKIGFDTAESDSSKVSYKGFTPYKYTTWISDSQLSIRSSARGTLGIGSISSGTSSGWSSLRWLRCLSSSCRGERPAGRAELLTKIGGIWAHAASAGTGTDPHRSLQGPWKLCESSVKVTAFWQSLERKFSKFSKNSAKIQQILAN